MQPKGKKNNHSYAARRQAETSNGRPIVNGSRRALVSTEVPGAVPPDPVTVSESAARGTRRAPVGHSPQHSYAERRVMETPSGRPIVNGSRRSLTGNDIPGVDSRVSQLETELQRATERGSRAAEGRASEMAAREAAERAAREAAERTTAEQAAHRATKEAAERAAREASERHAATLAAEKAAHSATRASAKSAAETAAKSLKRWKIGAGVATGAALAAGAAYAGKRAYDSRHED